MTESTRILVPIRYPLTDQSARTLAAAGRLAQDNAPATLRALHVNLYQSGGHTNTTDLTQAISSTLDGVEASVITRRGFLVEEVILDEATQMDAGIVVVGATTQAMWRRFLQRLLQNELNIGSFLREHTTDATEIMEVGATDEMPAVESV